VKREGKALTDVARVTESSTVRTGGTGEGTTAEPELTIQWVLGSVYGERHPLRGARLRVGRGAECHIRLEHPSVSRDHAELQRQGPIVALRDLGSTNGTYLNGERTEHGVIADNDVLRIGDFVGIVRLSERVIEAQPFSELAPELWGGPSLRRVLETAEAAAETDVPIIVIGETGTGKERVARAIHYLSGRRGRFQPLNCSTLPEELAEAELFGHARGAFTGAERARLGHLRAADGGTLFLDELAELSLSIQAKLLRAVEQREVIPLGETRAVPIDVRIVAAAQEPLERFVEKKTFRADLHERLAGFRFDLPPLRARREEVPGLFFHLLDKYDAGGARKPAAKLLERLVLHDWPGNVRELELFTRKLLALHRREAVLRPSFAEGILKTAPERRPKSLSNLEPSRNRREHDLRRLNAALEAKDGNLSAAAASIGISRRRAYRLLGSRSNGPLGWREQN
jgi:transcriptional regulator of acetoin/glycerol metabolism